MTDDDPYRRLGQVVRAARRDQGLKQTDLQQRGGPSHTTVGEIERGVAGAIHEGTKSALEKALLWAPGSVDAILEGGGPFPAPESPSFVPVETLPEVGVVDADWWPPGLDRDDPRAIEGALSAYWESNLRARGEYQRAKAELSALRRTVALALERVQELNQIRRILDDRLVEIGAWESGDVRHGRFVAQMELAARRGDLEGVDDE